MNPSDLQAAIDGYLEAYCESDRARRRALVRRVWSEDARLIDPPMTAHGHDQIEDQADALLAQFPGHRFRRASGIDAHHGRARYRWELVDAAGRVRLEGADSVRFADDGRLAEVVGFFGPMPQLDAAAAR